MFGLFGRRSHGSKEYLRPGRLEDVIALIQVLGLDRFVNRGENALQATLNEKPASGRSWCDVARRHPEFFRVSGGRGGDTVALIARRLTGRDEEGEGLKPADINSLLDAAIQLHSGQLQRKLILRATWVASLLAALPALFSVAYTIYTRRTG